MTRGTVAYFNDYRGWGIIKSTAQDQDIYVHYTAIKQDGFKTLHSGQEVSFELCDMAANPQAAAVYPVG